jgi:S1-C subfamily serine protease
MNLSNVSICILLFLGAQRGWLIATAFSVFLTLSSRGASQDVPEGMSVIGAQPSVFKVFLYENSAVKCPGGVRLKGSMIQSSLYQSEPVIVQEYEEAKRNGSIDSSVDRSSYCWQQVLSHPDEYLGATPDDTMVHSSGASGSAFAVSQEGILLTNAHVVSAPTKQEILSDLFVHGWADNAIRGLTAEIGGAPPARLNEGAVQGLFRWFSNHADVQSEVNTLIVVNFGKLRDTLDEILRSGSIPTADRLLTPKLTAGVTVLAKGEVYPGKDVAVIKIEPPNAESIKDKVICLQLGDSDSVLAEMKIHALGFPGGVFNLFNHPAMKDEAELDVSDVPGEISTPRQMSGDWTGFEMSADINHGYSGGPVIDLHGRAIAINVAGTEISGHKIAIPINIAKEFLNQAGVHPDPGPATAHWISALQLFSARNYAGAQKELDQLIGMQGGPSSKWVNRYVRDFYERCKRKLTAKG